MEKSIGVFCDIICLIAFIPIAFILLTLLSIVSIYRIIKFSWNEYNNMVENVD